MTVPCRTLDNFSLCTIVLHLNVINDFFTFNGCSKELRLQEMVDYSILFYNHAYMPDNPSLNPGGFPGSPGTCDNKNKTKDGENRRFQIPAEKIPQYPEICWLSIIQYQSGTQFNTSVTASSGNGMDSARIRDPADTSRQYTRPAAVTGRLSMGW
jgi:hypothetical protein